MKRAYPIPHGATARRRQQQAQAEQASLADQLASLDAHLILMLPAGLRAALQRERRRLLAEVRAQEGGQA